MRLTAEQQALVTENINFAYYLANKWANKQKVIAKEDLDSIAREALCTAAMKYDPSRGCNFINFAKMCINHATAKSIRDKLRHDRIEAKVVAVEVAALKSKARKDILEDHLQYSALSDALDQTSEKEREILEDCYVSGLSYKEIALKHGITFNQVKFVLSRTKKQLCKKIA